MLGCLRVQLHAAACSCIQRFCCPVCSPRLASPRLASLFPCPPPCLALHCPASCFPALPCAYPCPGSCFPCLRDPPVWPRSLACSAARWNYTTELNSITYTATFNRDGAPRSATGGRRGGGVAGMSLCGGGSLRRPPLKSLGVPLLDPPPHAPLPLPILAAPRLPGRPLGRRAGPGPAREAGRAARRGAVHRPGRPGRQARAAEGLDGQHQHTPLSKNSACGLLRSLS